MSELLAGTSYISFEALPGGGGGGTSPASART
jgi:hypothetical protein